MKVALIQAPLIWHNPKANRDYFAQQINLIHTPVDLIILPEMFTTGFAMQPHLVAETMAGDTVKWLKDLAKQKKCAVTGSLVVVDNGRYFNRMVFVFPSGEIQLYDKKHLFTLAGEDKVYTSGQQKIVINYLDWKICLQICYDLRFPVFSRNTEGYDLLIYVASWPNVRVNAWDALLKARAIENMSYVIGVNRIGKDENGYEYSGHSQIVNFLGDYVVEPQGAENTFIADLDKNDLLAVRNKLGFLEDRDAFELLG